MVNKLLMVGQQIKRTSMAARKPFRIMKAINTDIVSGLQQIMANGTAEGSIINGGSQVVNEGGLAENWVLNHGGTLMCGRKAAQRGYSRVVRARWLQPPGRLVNRDTR